MKHACEQRKYASGSRTMTQNSNTLGKHMQETDLVYRHCDCLVPDEHPCGTVQEWVVDGHLEHKQVMSRTKRSLRKHNQKCWVKGRSCPELLFKPSSYSTLSGIISATGLDKEQRKKKFVCEGQLREQHHADVFLSPACAQEERALMALGIDEVDNPQSQADRQGGTTNNLLHITVSEEVQLVVAECP